ncbi:uncharacterized protein si:dkey-111e8.4 [Hemibagrus wyckioides]|uniref:uncharacterized protein si:dkey-111e8.4 n=1 Tax=Hemibagrus wyckioides TaxID=337641 RepID=UPI00266B4D98|nr:uncharacterized protein si:dkey-111e8.4 [Hemibagrus wyckioides]
MDGTRVSPMSDWLNSDVFIIFVVVLLLTVIAIFAVCWVLRRRRTRKTAEKMAEVEIIPFTNSGRSSRPRFTLRVITEQKHASEIVQMLTGQICSTVDPVCATDDVSAVIAEVIDTSQDQSQIHALSSCRTETDSTLHTGQQVSSLDLQTANPNEHVDSTGITDNNEENDASNNGT